METYYKNSDRIAIQKALRTAAGWKATAEISRAKLENCKLSMMCDPTSAVLFELQEAQKLYDRHKQMAEQTEEDARALILSAGIIGM